MCISGDGTLDNNKSQEKKRASTLRNLRVYKRVTRVCPVTVIKHKYSKSLVNQKAELSGLPTG